MLILLPVPFLIYLVFVHLRRKNKGNQPKTTRKALITGATSGLGKALAVAMSELQWPLILAGRDRTALQRTVDFIHEKYGITQSIVVLDLLLPDSIDSCVAEIYEKHSDLEILVNNAGIGHRGSCMETSFVVYDKIIQTNFLGPLYLTKCNIAVYKPALLPLFRQNGRGHIVTVSSVQAILSIPNRTAYSASKAAISSFMTSLQGEVRADGIHVTTFFPAYIRTEFSRNALTGVGSSHSVMDENTSKGLDPDILVKKMLKAIIKKAEFVVYANWKIKLAIKFRYFFPATIRHYCERYS